MSNFLRSPLDIESVVEMVKAGMNDAAIGKALGGYHASSVGTFRRKHGIVAAFPKDVARNLIAEDRISDQYAIARLAAHPPSDPYQGQRYEDDPRAKRDPGSLSKLVQPDDSKSYVGSAGAMCAERGGNIQWDPR